MEGTTSSISFVHDVLFPYARERLPAFIEAYRDRAEVQAELERARASLRKAGYPASTENEIAAGLIRYIDDDVKDTALKALQGMIWKVGFESGAYRSHVYPDVRPALERWRLRGLRFSIYSSGSVAAQKLFFRHTEAGDLSGFFEAHFDTNVGPKKVASSYAAIVESLQREPREILFLSDVTDELDAARKVDIRTCQLIRDGTQPTGDHPTARSFDEVELQLGFR